MEDVIAYDGVIVFDEIPDAIILDLDTGDKSLANTFNQLLSLDFKSSVEGFYEKNIVKEIFHVFSYELWGLGMAKTLLENPKIIDVQCFIHPKNNSYLYVKVKIQSEVEIKNPDKYHYKKHSEFDS